MERIRKGSDLPKKVGVTEHPTKIFAHQANTNKEQVDNSVKSLA